MQSNLGLARSILVRFSFSIQDEDSRLSEALYGLARAIEGFDPWRGYRFSTYACNVIARALMRRAKRERRHRQLFPIQHDVSFESPSQMPDSSVGLWAERLDRVIKDNHGELTDLEGRVIAQRFPRNDAPALTFRQIGAAIGLSKERVRQIQNVALSKLRAALENDPILQ